MATTRHSLAQFIGTGALFIGVKGQATGVSGASITINSSTGVTGPLAQIADVTIARTAAGSHTLTINPFKGPQGGLIYSISAQTNGTTGLGVSHSATYTNDSVAISIVMSLTCNGTKTDGDFDFIGVAF